MRSVSRNPIVSAAIVAVGAVLIALAGAVPVAPAQAAAACNVTITPPPIYVSTTVHITVSGFTAGEQVNLVQTHNSSPASGTATASGAGTLVTSQPFALGTWSATWTGASSGLTCSTSFTVLADPATTTTTAAAASTTTAPAVAPATAVHATPAFTG